MSFGAKPMGPPPLRPRPPSRGDTAFAVGSRALITPTGSNNTTVQLLDEDGMPTTLSLPANESIVITAWRPRRSAPPRYRVCTSEKVEGWIDAANLRRLPPPPPPAPMIASSAPPPAPAKPGKAAAAKAAAAKAAAAKAAAAKAVAAKPAAALKPPMKVAEKALAKPAAKVAAPKPAPKPVAKPVAKTKARPASAARSKPKVPAGKPKSSRPAPKRAR
jgi:hypothetical protein